MKPMMLFLLLLLGLGAFSTPPIKVDERIEKQFAATFPKAESVKWYRNETHYEVLFLYRDAQCRITYRLDGAIERVERYYTAEALAPFVLAKIKAKYEPYQIHGVTEITTELGLIYYIILQGEGKWLQVQADESGNAYIIQRFKKRLNADTSKK